MDQRKYIGMDVHQASISIAVSDSSGKLVMDSVIETKATTVLGFIKGLNGSLWVTFEEGTSAAWLYDLLKPHVTKVSEETENVSPTEVTPKWAKGLKTLGGFFASLGGRLDKTGATCSRSSREQSVADQRCSACGRCE